MHRYNLRLLACLVLLTLSGGIARATLPTDYQFSSSSATYTPLTGATTAISGTNTGGPGSGTFNDTAVAGPINIGFSFQFDCLAYTTFTVSTNGVVYLGNQTSGSFNNDLANAPRYPVIAPWWDHQHLYNGGGGSAGCNFDPLVGVHYKLTGVAPNRVLTVEFNTQVCDAANSYWWAGCGLTMNRYQMRLFEGTNRIEFHYGSLWASSGQPTASTIGVANGTSNFLSVTPTGGTGTVSSAVSNNTIQQHVSLIPAGTVFAFTPCYIRRTGNTNLATPSMAPGDSVLVGQSVVYGDEATFTPFNLDFPSGPCASHNYTLTISGPGATDYRWQGTGSQTLPGIISAGTSVTPPIIFRPSTTGVRQAFLSITDNTTGCTVIHYLTAAGTTRAQWVGDLAQGAATITMNNGDTLFNGYSSTPGVTQNWTPLTVTNISTMDLVPGMPVTYTVIGGNGQYSLSTPGATLASTESSTPVVTFTPDASAVGPQVATLTATVDGQTRDFVLYATVNRRDLTYLLNGNAIDSNSATFVAPATCAGEAIVTYPLDLVNTGNLPVQLFGISSYLVDSVDNNGSPSWPLSRDGSGNPIPAGDYFITMNPGTLPITPADFPSYPLAVPGGATLRVYINFVGQRPGVRYARVFISTDAMNVTSADPFTGAATEGLMSFNAFGTANGAILSESANQTLRRPVVFETTPVGDTARFWLSIVNPGQCDLRIDEGDLMITSGDVEEFSLLRTSATWTRDPSTGDLLLPSGARDSILFTFHPRQIGSRRATLRMRSNDSMVVVPGLTERGTYYMDLYGEGSDGLYVNNATFPVTEIGASSSPRQITLRNAADAPFIIQTATIIGIDAADFVQDPANPWPTTPFAVIPGQLLRLSIVFSPTGATAGSRSAMLVLVSDRGDTIRAALSGEAGVKSVTGPTTINFGSLSVGNETRKTISITNAGSMPATVGDPVISGANAGEFTATALVRHNLVPGQTETIEVTWRPGVAGSSSATMTIAAEGGDVIVALSGNAVKSKLVDDDPSGTIGSNDGGGIVTPGTQSPTGAASVDGTTRANGISLRQAVPNPTRDRAEIRFGLERTSSVTIELFDETGRMIRLVDKGTRAMGDHRMVVDLSTLPVGTYRVVLTSDGTRLTQPVTVVR